MLNVYIGFDAAETVAYHVLSQSLLEHASGPLRITPLVKRQVANVYRRTRGPLESTDFSLTRFLVPYLSDYHGFSLFLDCDMLVQSDPYELLLYGLAHPEKAVQVVQHDYTPTTTTKFLNQPQTTYPRKNWSSVMLFNNARLKQMTPDYLNTATPLALHRFEWVPDAQIGALPLEWNWLVGEYEPNVDAKLLHYTLGTPCFKTYQHGPEAQRWFQAYDRMTAPFTVQVS
jgi:hypothetical protein